MSQTTQYFFSIEKLQTLINQFSDPKYSSQFGGRTLQGFVFTPGINPATNAPIVFAFPLFSYPGQPSTDNGLMVQNLSMSYSGCPYPPPCN
jgi:hypothetical protein